MALIRWQPFAEIENLHRQMDRMFDEVVGVNRQMQVMWKPAVELQDTEENVVLRAEIPGVEGKDIDVRVTREAVVISGENRYEKKAEQNGLFRSEFRYGKFQRVIGLPVAIENDKVQAEFNNGILTLTMPKATEARRKVVKVNLADSSANATEVTAAPVSNDANEADNANENQPAQTASA